MILPNTLGIFSVVGLAFYQSYSSDKTYFSLLVVLAAITLFASGSGTGMLVLFVFLSMLILNNSTGLRKWALAVSLFVLGAVLLAKLPAVIHRPDMYDSVFSSSGRVSKLIEIVSESSAMEILIGRGVGFGTNTATGLISADLFGGNTSGDSRTEVMGGSFSADSTVTVLLTQLGIAGVILFYGILVWAYRRDPETRPAYLVFAITSLTINITEVFPVNFLLGLMLAGTLSLPSRARGSALRYHHIPQPTSNRALSLTASGGSRWDRRELRIAASAHRKI
jgi:hypothetical protein